MNAINYINIKIGTTLEISNNLNALVKIDLISFRLIRNFQFI